MIDESRELVAGDRTAATIRHWLDLYPAAWYPDERLLFVRAMHATIDPDLALDVGGMALTLLCLAEQPSHRYVWRALIDVATAIAMDVATEAQVNELASELRGL